MRRQEDSYQPGEAVYFYEFDRVDIVEVMENMCNYKNSHEIRYKFRVLENVYFDDKKEESVKRNDIDLVFECTKLRLPLEAHGRKLVMWRLLDTKDFDIRKGLDGLEGI